MPEFKLPELPKFNDHEKHYSEVWISLLYLLVISISFAWLSVPHWLALVLIFGISLLKAGFVVQEFMHLKNEHKLLALSAATPLVLLAIMWILFYPDFGIADGF